MKTVAIIITASLSTYAAVSALAAKPQQSKPVAASKQWCAADVRCVYTTKQGATVIVGPQQ